MSEPAPEPAARAPARGGGNVLTNRIGPLPMWAWVAIAGGILIVWRVMAGKKSQSSQQQDSTGDTSQVPQFVNQTYTTVTAPSAPTGTTPTPGPGGGSPPPTPVPPNPTTPHPAPRPLNVPPSVTGLRATGTGATNVRLAWNPSAGASQYQVRVTYQQPNGQAKQVKTFMTNGTSYNVTGLAPNRTYGLHVVAINGNQWAPETSIVQKTT